MIIEISVNYHKTIYNLNIVNNNNKHRQELKYYLFCLLFDMSEIM